MLVEVPVQRPLLYPQGQENLPSIGEYNEQVLRLMHSLGIDQQKTIEVKQHVVLTGLPSLSVSHCCLPPSISSASFVKMKQIAQGSKS